MSSPSPCAFCNQVNVSGVHDCVTKAYELLNALATPKNTDSVFNSIDNLVFQGGGVKGISYLGVIGELQSINPRFLNNIKRIAGTSAGSLMALYLGLNMDLETEIKPLLDKDYSALLDSDLKLKVCTNPTSVISSYSYMKPAPSTRIVVLSALQMLQDFQDRIKSSTVEDEITEMFYNIIRYYAIYQGSGYNMFASVKATSFAKAATKWLMGMLTPNEDVTKSFLKRDASKSHKEEEKKSDDSSASKPAEEEEKSSFPTASSSKDSITLENTLDRAFDKAHERVRNNQEIPQPATRVKAGPVQDQTKTATEEVKRDTNTVEAPNDHFEFYRAQKEKKPQGIAEEEPFLKGINLHYALAEMIWFIGISHELDLGLFSATIIKKTLIEDPIQQKLSQFNIENPAPTFADLYSYEKDGKKIFKDFYITAFNTETFRTEVFSASHTPNVVVADAVRASMSIPVFFTPVTIRENGQPRLIYYNGGNKSEPIRYMDGGILDNYPIWIFDDLKYCLQDSLMGQWKPQHKILIHNPRTLGFRILDQERINAYLEPFYDRECMKQKRINNVNYDNSFGYAMGTLASGELSEHEESIYINCGNYSRSAYINNLGISAISFDLTPGQKEQLIEQGRKSVKDYVSRARRNFANEGQIYPQN